MCLPWCCHPYTDVHLKDPPPKKKEEEKRVNHTVDNQAPILTYPVGLLDFPSSPFLSALYQHTRNVKSNNSDRSSQNIVISFLS